MVTNKQDKPLMKFEDYIQSCSHWVRLYEKVWGFKCWGEDWVEKGLSEYRLPFWRKAEQIDREWSSFEDFDEIGSSQMVEMYQMVMMAGVGMRMAALMLKAKEEDVATLHLETLFRYGLLAFLLDKQDPYTTLSWWRWIILYEPVMREMKRRGKKHVGFPAGLYKVLSAIEEWSGIPSEAIPKRIDELRKRVRVPHSVFTTLKAREFDYENPQLGYEFTKNEILSQIFITLDERCDEDPFHALGDSLEGKMNILPRAVKDDIVDQVRKSKRREDRIKVHLLLEEEPHEDDPHEDDLYEEALNKRDPNKEGPEREAWGKAVELNNLPTELEFKQDVDKKIDRWAAGNPKKKLFFQMLAAGYILKEAAQKAGIHQNTATNWRKELSKIEKLREALCS